MQVNFRMPVELKERLEEAAKASGRTLTAELLTRVQASFDAGPDAAALREEIARLKERAELRDRAVDIALASQDMLAQYLVAIIDRLPVKAQAEPSIALALRFANGLLNRDGPALADTFADLFADDESVVQAMRQLRADLAESRLPKRPTPPEKKLPGGSRRGRRPGESPGRAK